MSNLKILYGESCQDHIPIYYEFNINHPVEFTFDELTQTGNLKAGLLLDQVADDQIYLYRNSLEDISIDLWDDVLSCHSVQWDSNYHNKLLERLYNTLMQCLCRLIISTDKIVSYKANIIMVDCVLVKLLRL